MKIGELIKLKLKDVSNNDCLVDDTTIHKSERITVFSIYPKLNTSICDEQTIQILKLANEFPQVNFISISNDKVETISSWCGSHNVKNSNIYSDRFYGEFAKLSKWKIPVINVFERGLVITINGQIKEIIKNKNIKKQVDFAKLEASLKLLIS